MTMRGFLKHGYPIPTVAELPDEIAKFWIDYLAEDPLQENELVSTDTWSDVDGDLELCCIYRSPNKYVLAIEPLEEAVNNV